MSFGQAASLANPLARKVTIQEDKTPQPEAPQVESVNKSYKFMSLEDLPNFKKQFLRCMN